MLVIIREFWVAEEFPVAFKQAYGAQCRWAELFGQQDGHEDTEILHDALDTSRYVTIDRWRSREDSDRFKRRFGQAHEALDRICEGLTITETRFGVFQRQMVHMRRGSELCIQNPDY